MRDAPRHSPATRASTRGARRRSHARGPQIVFLSPSLPPFTPSRTVSCRAVPYLTLPYLTLPCLPYRTVPHLRRAPLIAPKKGLAGLKFSKKESDYWKEKDPSKNVICKCERVTEAEVTPTLTPTLTLARARAPTSLKHYPKPYPKPCPNSYPSPYPNSRSSTLAAARCPSIARRLSASARAQAWATARATPTTTTAR